MSSWTRAATTGHESTPLDTSHHHRWTRVAAAPGHEELDVEHRLLEGDTQHLGLVKGRHEVGVEVSGEDVDDRARGHATGSARPLSRRRLPPHAQATTPSDACRRTQKPCSCVLHAPATASTSHHTVRVWITVRGPLRPARPGSRACGHSTRLRHSPGEPPALHSAHAFLSCALMLVCPHARVPAWGCGASALCARSLAGRAFAALRSCSHPLVPSCASCACVLRSCSCALCSPMVKTQEHEAHEDAPVPFEDAPVPFVRPCSHALVHSSSCVLLSSCSFPQMLFVPSRSQALLLLRSHARSNSSHPALDMRSHAHSNCVLMLLRSRARST